MTAQGARAPVTCPHCASEVQARSLRRHLDTQSCTSTRDAERERGEGYEPAWKAHRFERDMLLVARTLGVPIHRYRYSKTWTCAWVPRWLVALALSVHKGVPVTHPDFDFHERFYRAHLLLAARVCLARPATAAFIVGCEAFQRLDTDTMWAAIADGDTEGG